ncbi:gliding motility-associated C-terminal domain-containing protein [Bacteroidota bacterium]
MRKLLVPILISISFFTLRIEIKAQTLEIKNVSVINNLGHVRISWEYTGVDNLEIFRDSLEISNLSPLQTITDPTVTSFIDYSARAHIKPRSYKIQSEINSSIRTDKVSTFYLTYDYDSCLKEMNLAWDDLETSAFTANDWTPSQFIINIFEGAFLRTINVDPSNNVYAVPNILENTNHSIYIETQWQGQDSTSYSNPIYKYTQMPASPSYINSLSTIADGSNTNLKFEIASNSELEVYKLLRSDTKTGIYDTLETYTTTSTEINATHTNSNPDSKINFYKLVSVNACGNPTTNSEIINNILLQAEIDEFDVNISWNTYKQGSLISTDYEIYRIVANSSPELIGTLSNLNSFDDNIETLQNNSQFCYYISAREQASIGSDYSQSNTACVFLEPKVYIPEAFTPNGDGINDLFQPKFSFIPKDFEFRVYNRWGNVIFETSDYSKPWNGNEPNGKSAPAGSYIYYLMIKSPNDQIVEKRGNILVIYP